MAKKKDEKKPAYQYPSRFGSHASMVIAEETDNLGDPELCVCKDEFGLYVTERRRIDNKLADPYRHASQEWRAARMKELTGQVIEIIDLE